MDDRGPLRLATCDAGRTLCEGVAGHLGAPIVDAHDVWFACGEGKFVVGENVRGTDVYLFQQPVVPGDPRSVNDRFAMLLHAVDALRHADAERVNVVLPYLPGGRQDKRKGRTREGVSTGLYARMLEAAGASMLITVEPHNEATAGCFNPRLCVFEPLYVATAFARWLDTEGLVGRVVASTDVGGLHRARRFAQVLQRDIVALSKERDYSRTSAVDTTQVVGDVEGPSVLIVDDIVDTAGSVVSAVQALWAGGATDVVIATVHPIFSAPAWDRMHALAAEAHARGRAFRFVGTSSIRHANPPSWYRSFPLEAMLAEAIASVNHRGSVSGICED